MSRGIHARGEPIRVIAGVSIIATYEPAVTAAGVVEFQHLIRQLTISNTTDGYILITFDESLDQMRLVPGQAVFFDFTANKAGGKDGFFLGMGDAVFVRQSSGDFPGDTDPTTGYVTVSAYYADGDGGTNSGGNS